MRNMNATRKGPGRRPQTVSTIRAFVKKNGDSHPLLRDFSGAKLMRKAANKKCTINH